MIRTLLEEGGLFVLPFVAFGLILLLQRKRVLQVETWTGASAWLVVAGLVLVIGGFVATGLFGERHTGRYVPPHMENGQPVPGSFD